MSASAVDAALRRPAVVYGSLPPSGRDLDLLLDSGERERLREALVGQGWVVRGRTAARFGDGTAYAVDLVDMTDWAPNEAVGRAISERSEPIPGYERLRAPAPHHQVLILARRFARGMQLDERKRSRLDALNESVWREAAAEAPDWGLVDAVTGLRREHLSPSPATPGRPAGRVRLRRRRPAVLSLSGLDGAGKSTQAELLHDALQAMGYEVRVEWSKIARDPALKVLSAPVRAVLNLVHRVRPIPAPAEPAQLPDPDGETRNYPDGPPPPPDAAKLVRQRSRLLTALWTCLVAWTNATTHRRAVSGPCDVVICDRYVLDSLAHLRYRYGYDRHFRAQGWIVRLRSPRPARAFFLDVAPATARARKPEQYTTADLVRLRECYVEAAARLGDVVVVDPTRPVEEVAALVAREAWTSLG